MSQPHDNRLPLDAAMPPWRTRAIEALDFPLGKFLDYGCGGCGLMECLEDRCDECHGVDVDKAAYAAAEKQHTNFLLSEIGQDGRTKYPDEYFDTIAIIEVIEHVPDESVTLRELARILKPGGKLLLTTPHRGLLTFLDVGNFKFVFPRLHRFIHLVLMRNQEYYKERFERTKEIQLVGDVSVSGDRRPWHRHYKPQQIESYCPSSLRLDQHQVYFPGLRLMMLLRQVLRVFCLGRFSPFPPPFSWAERWLSTMQSRGGDQLVMLMEKLERQGASTTN
ncbi:MAG: methyltransferase domain-containing protein [Planctomycetes bacterium]|nr:methyltransferase domain-containing protein [Planctomycetota bacterium]